MLKSSKIVLFCIISALLLFVGFFKNTWRVADENWFVNFQLGTESYILGRLVESRQAGIFSYGGLTGLGSLGSLPTSQYTGNTAFQYKSYYQGDKFESYLPYESQIGGQGMVFSILDKIVPLPLHPKVGFFHAIDSFLSAIALAAVILWFYMEFGLPVGLFVLVSTILSQWLVVMGKNLWWSMWVFFLPMILVMYYLRQARNQNKRQMIIFGMIVFLGVFIKCFFNGYEFITTTLIMMMVPFVYYSIADRVSVRRFIGAFLIGVISAFAAILLSFAILIAQIASVEGTFQKGIDHIVYSLEKRTYDNPDNLPAEYTTSLEASPGEVVLTYLDGIFFDFNNYIHTSNAVLSAGLFQVRYWYLIIAFAIFSALAFLDPTRRKISGADPHKVALVSGLWVSILAPLSWFVIFKAHSFIHTHIDFVVWQMPFTLFGFAVCGMALQNIFSNLLRRPRPL
jgi:hypothetical protein